MTELLLASPLDNTQRRYGETLQQSAKSLLAVLNDVLDFSKLEAGHCELDLAPFDLHDLVQGIAAGLQARASEKGLASGVDIGASCPRRIKGDAARIRQILDNLIDNALKFTSEGSVRLRARARARRAARSRSVSMSPIPGSVLARRSRSACSSHTFRSTALSSADMAAGA